MAERLEAVRARIDAACARAGRAPEDVTLVAAGKHGNAAAIAEVVAAGQRVIGENRVQEALGKIAAVGRDGIQWHMIGHLQTNKAAAVASAFDMVESVDSLRVATALARHRHDGEPPLPVLLQVNVAADPAKSGFAPNDLRRDFAELTRLPGLRVDGLMTIGPIVASADASRPTFAALRELRDELDAAGEAPALTHLSMGMSADFEVAIEEGATLVRVGTALFGHHD